MRLYVCNVCLFSKIVLFSHTQSLEELRGLWKEGKAFTPDMKEETRANYLKHWRKAIDRSLDWA